MWKDDDRSLLTNLRNISILALLLILLCGTRTGLSTSSLEGEGNAPSFTRQRAPLVKDGGVHMEFIHIAKTAGRAMKIANERMEPSTRPFSESHGHSVRVSDVLRRNHTAVVVLRDPADRMESAFTFVRTGGFGNRLPKEHLIGEFNTSDAFVEALAGKSILAIEAVRCDAKLVHCAVAPNTQKGEEFSFDKHATVEFRSQKWWLDAKAGSVRIICYPDLHKVFPTLKRKNDKATILDRSRKGHWFVERYLSAKARQRVYNLYPEDTQIYNQYCSNM